MHQFIKIYNKINKNIILKYIKWFLLALNLLQIYLKWRFVKKNKMK